MGTDREKHGHQHRERAHGCHEHGHNEEHAHHREAACMCEHGHHDHKHTCACGHGHGHHEHGDTCACGHEHHDHEHGAACSCGRDHGHGCGCGHEQEHGCGCGCGHDHGPAGRWEKIKLAVAAVLFAVGLVVPNETAKLVMFVVSYLLAGYDVVFAAVTSLLRGGMFDERLLMTIATVGAAAVGEFSEAAAVMILYGVGEVLEHAAVDRSEHSIRALARFRADIAHRLRDGESEDVSPDAVAIGDLIVVKPHELAPLDGIVVEGESLADLSALTGESVPVRVTPGYELLSGSLNGDGALTVRVTKPAADSTVSRIIKLTEQARRDRAPGERFITRFARVYTPAVVALAVLVAVVPPFVLRIGTFREWLYSALTFLVVSCPCALVISVPLAYFAGIGGAARRGIFVKGSSHLETLAAVGTLASDKTGTLTEGVFRVLSVHPEDGVSGQELVRLCAGAELMSRHPVAVSIVKSCDDLPAEDSIADAQEIPGRGVSAVVEGRRVVAGSARLMTEQGLAPKPDFEGGTTVHVAVDGVYTGHLALGDRLKADAADAVAELGRLGIRTVLLTGDSEGAARAAASEAGVSEYHSGLLPEDKVNILKKLKGETAGKVAFVGDGVNDAPVIATADVGISMGGLGSDAAVEASDVVLMTDEPGKLVAAVRGARHTHRIVVQNIALALGVKGFIIVLGLLRISSMWLAIIGDVGVALLAVLNSLRAYK